MVAGGRLPRLQLFEFGDAPWLPALIRKEYLACLNSVQKLLGAYRYAYRPFSVWARQVGAEEVLDLASGGGYPIAEILKTAAEAKVPVPRIILSDLFPAPELHAELQEKHNGKAELFNRPLSIQEAPSAGYSAVSICGALHHLPPSDAAALLRACAASGGGLFILEPYQRTAGCFLSTLLAGVPLGMLSPFFEKRVSMRAVLLRTLLPIVPLLLQFDGLVSVLRSYRPEELTAMLDEELRMRLRIKHGRLRSRGGLSPNFYYLAPASPETA